MKNGFFRQRQIELNAPQARIKRRASAVVETRREKMTKTRTSIFTIKGIDRMMDETYVSDKVYCSKAEAWDACRVSEWVEEWAFHKVISWMDNSTDIIYRNVKTGEEKKSPGMFAHGDLC
jgi:glyceraldehyde-3-phosphate dehydrogenase/erythrose-4-phosphate dehydrogenase